MENSIALAIADDDKLIVQLVSEFLSQSPEISVVLTAFSGNDLILQLNSRTPEQGLPSVLLLDLKMEDGDGLEIIDQLTRDFPELKIIVLSSYYKPSFIGYMFRSGVHAFLPKGTDKEELLKIICEVYAKGFYYTAEQLDMLRTQVSKKSPEIKLSSKESLSEREIEVLKLICRQLSAREIADKLFLSPKTVEVHKSNLLMKTGVKNTAGLIIYAIQNGIVKAEDLVLLE